MTIESSSYVYVWFPNQVILWLPPFQFQTMQAFLILCFILQAVESIYAFCLLPVSFQIQKSTSSAFLKSRQQSDVLLRSPHHHIQGRCFPGRGDFEKSKRNYEQEMCKNLDISFRYVWLRLFTSGTDENYVLALRNFIKNSVHAYDAGYSLQALILELSRSKIETGDTKFDSTVQLTFQQRKTREVWLRLIYLTLDRLNYQPQSSAVKPSKPEDTSGLSTLVYGVCEALKAGFSHDGLMLELSLRKSSQSLSPAQLSLRSQWTRIVFLTSETIKFQSA